MNRVVKDKIAIIRPTGYLDGITAESYFAIGELNAIEKMDIEACFISLAGVVLFNANAVAHMERLLHDIAMATGMVVGFCEYDYNKYQLLQKFLRPDTKLTLFESEAVMRLFVGSFKMPKKVAIRTKSPLQRGMMLLALHERGHIPVALKEDNEKNDAMTPALSKAEDVFIDIDDEKSKIPIDNKEAENDVDTDYSEESNKEFDVTVNLTRLPAPALHINSYIKSNAIVYSLNGFLDSQKMSEFDKQYFQNSLKIGFKLFIFECTDVTGLNVHAVNFIYSLAVAAAEYNATIVIAAINNEKLTASFLDTLQRGSVIFMPSLDAVFADDRLISSTVKADIKNQKEISGVSKELIKNLSHFSYAIMDTIETMTGATSKKLSSKIGMLETSLFCDDYIATSLGFYGYASGMMALIYHKEIAKKMCRIFFGGESFRDSDISDALGEILNIMAGKTKTHLAKAGVSINITLPKTFATKEEFVAFISSKKGAIVEFELHENKFLLFLCS